MSKALVLTIGFALGWASRDLLQFKRTHTIHDIRVLDKIDDQHYRLTFVSRPSDDFKVLWCSPEPQFRRNMVFRDITYEDRSDCWTMKWTDNAKLGFKLYPGYYPNYKENYVGAGETGSESGTETTAQVR